MSLALLHLQKQLWSFIPPSMPPFPESMMPCGTLVLLCVLCLQPERTRTASMCFHALLGENLSTLYMWTACVANKSCKSSMRTPRKAPMTSHSRTLLILATPSVAISKPSFQKQMCRTSAGTTAGEALQFPSLHLVSHFLG